MPDVNSDYRDDTTANVQEFVPKPETLHPTLCRVGNVTNVTSGLFCGMHACAVLSDHVCNVCVFLCLFVCLFVLGVSSPERSFQPRHVNLTAVTSDCLAIGTH